ncbi:MAG: hypothetical protein R6W82_09150 [bacterium]
MADEREDWRSLGGYDLDDEGGLEVIEEGYGKYRRPDAEDPEEEKERKSLARRQMRVAAAVVVVAVGTLLYFMFSGDGVTESEQLREITSLEEADYLFALEGETAVQDIRRRFPDAGDRLSLIDGVVARYLFLQHPAELWVGVSPLQENAAEDYSLLLEATDPEQSDRWRAQSQLVRGSTSITQVVGRGQRNYFYRDSNMLVWITADSVAAPFVLQAALGTNLREWIAGVRQGGD